MLDASQRFPDVVDAVSVGYADEAFSGLAERGARHAGHFLFFQQQLTERIAAQPGLPDVREDIERAVRQMALQADPVESGNDEVAAG